MLVLGLLGCSIGCSSQAERPSEPLVEKSDPKADDEILYNSIVDVFSVQGLDVRLRSAEKGLVLTEWTEVNREVRHRWVGRVVRAKLGLVLKVHSEYERRDTSGAEARWVQADDPYTARDARRDEETMGEAIQKRFRSLGGGRK